MSGGLYLSILQVRNIFFAINKRRYICLYHNLHLYFPHATYKHVLYVLPFTTTPYKRVTKATPLGHLVRPLNLYIKLDDFGTVRYYPARDKSRRNLCKRSTLDSPGHRAACAGTALCRWLLPCPSLEVLRQSPHNSQHWHMHKSMYICTFTCIYFFFSTTSTSSRKRAHHTPPHKCAALASVGV